MWTENRQIRHMMDTGPERLHTEHVYIYIYIFLLSGYVVHSSLQDPVNCFHGNNNVSE